MERPLSEKEMEVIINDVVDKYGYDFSEYSKASMMRRINYLFITDRFVSFAEMRYRIKNDEQYLPRFIECITVSVTEMFRDPHFYRALATDVLPVLATYPLIRIWHAGCATGEEVYSMAILLKEHNLLHKSLLYATDISPVALEKANNGIYNLSQMKLYSENYIDAGGKHSLSDYYHAQYESAKFDNSLRARMVFSTHNLAMDSSFNEFQLILCRNVLIYFDHNLQNKVFKLFDNSLERLGFLALGTKESLRFSSISQRYKQGNVKEKIWRKMKGQDDMS
jgi:chemotaxis protein methyltransferase CheR